VATPPSHRRVVAACTAVLFVPLLVPLLTGQVFAFNDLGRFHLPIRHLYQEALRAGDSLLWSPALFSGYYLFGEGQAGMAHPLHLLLYRFLPLDVAFNLEIVASYVALLAGTRLLLARYGLGRDASWFGAMVFTFSGFNLLHLIHVNAIAVLAHGPFLLLAAHTLLTSPQPSKQAWAFLSLAMLTASQLLLGFPQCVWFTTLALGCQTMGLLMARLAPFRALLRVGSAVLLGVMIGGVQILPTLDVLQGSIRSEVSREFRSSFSLQPKDLLFLWAPNSFPLCYLRELCSRHELSTYTGGLAIAAPVWLAIRWQSVRHRALAAALLALAVLAGLLALGPYGWIYPWLSELPGLAGFRAPARHVVLLHFALAGLAAIAFEDIAAVARSGPPLAWPRLLPLALPFAASVTTTLVVASLAGPDGPAMVNWEWPHENLWLAWPWVCGLAVVSALLIAAGRGRPWAISALVVTVVLDQGTWGYAYVYAYGPRAERVQSLKQLVASIPAPAGVAANDVVFVPRLGGPPGNLSVLRNVRLSTGYTGLMPERVHDPADPVFQRAGGVAWRINGEVWTRVAGTMPRARLVSIAQQSQDVPAAIASIDLARVALVTTPVKPLAGEPGSARIVADRPGAIEVQTTAPGPQLLIVTERFHEGWRATEDGTPISLVRVYGQYLGCVVSPGTHTIALRFAPASLRAGLITSGAGVMLTLAATWFLRRRSKAEG
jgi:hypothetical protein